MPQWQSVLVQKMELKIYLNYEIMKVTILKKSIKEGVSARTGSEYKIRNLFVKFDDEKVYNGIVNHLKKKGATIDQIEKFCKPNEYKGAITYAFGLNCSGFTFDRVEQFGELDAAIIFQISDQGFINAKINVINRKEQVLGYTPPESEVEGWAVEAPEVSQEVDDNDLKAEPIIKDEDPLIPMIEDDDQLPF